MIRRRLKALPPLFARHAAKGQQSETPRIRQGPPYNGIHGLFVSKITHISLTLQQEDPRRLPELIRLAALDRVEVRVLDDLEPGLQHLRLHLLTPELM